MALCPNCRQPVEDGRLMCPQCGAFVTPTGAQAWLPAAGTPGSVVPGAGPPPERLLTGRRWLDFWVGFLPPPALTVLFAVGVGEGKTWLTVGSGVLFLVTLVLCAVLPRRRPVVARGLAWGLIAIPLLLTLLALGAFAVCLYAVFNSGTHR